MSELPTVDIQSIDPQLLTPAMRQYQQYKAQYPDAILFFRMGDFYELFYEDARTAARALGLALTVRSKENPVPMAGVPYHAVDGYLQRMIAAGFKVAICEQMEDPKLAKGLVRREVVRLVTPGTLTEESMLDGREENFMAAVIVGKAESLEALRQQEAAIAWCELSTGKFLTFQGSLGECLEELARIRPRELLYAEGPAPGRPVWAQELRDNVTFSLRPAWQLETHNALKILREQYGVVSFQGFGYEEKHPLALRAAGAVVAYLHETQKAALEHLRPPQPFLRHEHLAIDPASLRSLEVLRTVRSNSVDGSLVGAIDRTRTAMGSRLLRNWLCYPLRNLAAIEKRQNAIASLLEAPGVLASIRQTLGECSDIERITARICCRRVSPRDLVALARSFESLLQVGQALSELPGAAESAGGYFGELLSCLPQCQALASQIRGAIGEEPPAHLREGGVIRDGADPELDRLRRLATDSRTWLAEYQARLSASSGIPTLKVGFNKVFGYYIEITHTHSERIPAEFIRKQTVKNAERYITPELKNFETDVLSAQDKSVALEQELFEQLRVSLVAQVQVLQTIALATATLDLLAALAALAGSRGYCRPQMTATREFYLLEARHPVIEQTLGDTFVANDTHFQDGGPTLHLITGPNMAGKSTFIRQVALLTLMAHAGAYLPAREARIGLVDRIFTRIGASDDLAAGQSTFMVEMIETATILHHATERSLVILDEIGRGTSTLDGLALAWAIAEFLADTLGARTLFATHYHELTELAQTSTAVANFNVLVREWEDQVIFMHRIGPGSADRSYGVHVARLAGVPRSVVQRARTLMGQLAVHVSKGRPKVTVAKAEVSLFDSRQQKLLSQLKDLDLNRLSPMQAWETLRSLQAELL